MGISYLRDAQNDQLKEQWLLRMSKSNAFLIEANPTDDWRAIIKALGKCIATQGIHVGVIGPCVLTFFVDLQDEVDPKLLQQIKCIENGVKNVLKANIQAVVQFGYVGELGMKNPEVQRKNACKLADANLGSVALHRLCLVASSCLDSLKSNEWKPVCVYLDVLSRQAAPADLLPGIGSGYVGYLRYDEFDVVAYDALVAQDKELNDNLGTGGREEFQKLLNEKKYELQKMVKDNFPINGSCQPLHPDMFPAPGGLLGRLLGRSKRQDQFTAAQKASEKALWMTAQRLQKDIAHAFDSSMANTEAILKELAYKASLGLKLQENADDMIKLLTAPAGDHAEPSKPTLPFSEGGCTQEIQAYLEDVRDYACSVQIQRFYTALQDACSMLTGAAEKKEAELTEEQERIKNQLKHMGSLEDFYKKYAFKDLPDKHFAPVIAAGVASKFLLCTIAWQPDVEAFAKGATPVYCIAAPAPDNAPLKGVQIVFLDYPGGKPENVMYDLLPEVII